MVGYMYTCELGHDYSAVNTHEGTKKAQNIGITEETAEENYYWCLNGDRSKSSKESMIVFTSSQPL